MPFLEYPSSDAFRLEFLEACTGMAESDIAKGKNYLPENIVVNLKSTLTDFKSVYLKGSSLLTERHREVREKNESMDRVERYVRDFYEVLKRRTYRLEHKADIFGLYNISFNGDIPDIKTERKLLNAAEHIISGEAKAVEKGFPAMENPTAAEVETELLNARKELKDVGPADSSYQEVQFEISQMREPVDELIREVAEYLHFNLRKKSSSTTRRVMRSYGFKYRYLKNEPVEEDLPETS
ncbi:hypothetical protein [Marinifilum sp.]|uniref:hypothetical protein n=1 Tax=Marinifilum sp. TaxID=2033137 RepID=UPI003BA8E108